MKLTFALCISVLLSCTACGPEKKPATAAKAASSTSKTTSEVSAPTATPLAEAPVSKTSEPIAPAVSPIPAGPSAGAAEAELPVDSPTRVIQKYTEELKSIVEPTKQVKNGKRDLSKEKKIAEKVRQFFDFEGLAKMSLGRHWSKVTSAQRDEYSELFVGLIEDSYLRRTRDIVGEYKIVYGKEEINGVNAKATCRVVRDDADVDITYDLHKNPKNWMIYNITLDNVDLVRNYQTQFNRIILNEGFAGLLKRLKKKKDDIEKDEEVL